MKIKIKNTVEKITINLTEKELTQIKNGKIFTSGKIEIKLGDTRL